MFESFHYYPLYANIPAFAGWNQISEQQIMEDLSYLQQMYPAYVRQLQSKINNMLNTMDFEGSMIYDQYPDKIQLERFLSSFLASLNNEQQDTSSDASDGTQTPETDAHLKELITVLFYDELLKRRHKQQKYYYLDRSFPPT